MSGSFPTVSYSMPMAVPGKGNQYPTYTHYSMSPPECDDDMSSASGVPSYSNSGYTATASYIGSNDYDSTNSASGIDFQEYMQDRFANSFNPIPLDRSMAVQAQTWVTFSVYPFDEETGHVPARRDRGSKTPDLRRLWCTNADWLGNSSGKLNAKHRELLDLQKQAQARLAKTRERFQDGMRDAREVRGDLEWTQKKVSSLQAKAARKHPKEYRKARERFPSPEY
ncbi:putative domain KxDL [Metarhizium rileyi]|uniref:Biogenesis of lysosome-related organelles complex 1 subunit KXD1 n=1 Tax=Metarhizium rileyi (strain RCEF 4871) TaxID=1649241 RepID=A0A162LX66_METRR|nr:putative domain KxDL [Metarhizium rileyi RCEF 4871]